MATLSVSSGSIMRPRRIAKVRHFPEAASQSFVLGEVVILATDANKGNQIKVGASDPADFVIVGVAAEDASGVENTKIAVWPADEDTEFVAHVEDAATLDADDIGDEVGIVFDATNRIVRVDRSDTSTKVVKITELIDPVGTVNGRVAFKFLNAKRGVFAS